MLKPAMLRSRHHFRRPTFCLAIAFLLAAVPAAEAVPAFYDSLFHRGRDASALGSNDEAKRLLRIACFGMLEEPKRLAACLVELALVHAADDDREAFRETFTRLAEVERRFGGYREASISTAARDALSAAAGRWISFEFLSSVPGFAEAARARHRAEVSELAPEARREALRELVETEPEDAGWWLLLAESELAEGRSNTALEAAEGAIGAAPEDAHAHCLRGRAHALGGRCSDAVGDLDRCADPSLDPELAEATVSCLVHFGYLDQARRALDALPNDVRRQRRFRRLGQDLEAAQDAGANEAPPEPEESTPDPTRLSKEMLDDDQRSALTSARESLREQNRDTLEAAHTAVASIVNEVPESVEASLLLAELSYRLGRWTESVEFFQRVGRDEIERPEMLFYFAVALYETGDHDQAAMILEPALPQMQRTPFVDEYADKILDRQP